MCGFCAGTKLLKHVLDLCEQDQSILDVYLHVQINNNEAIEFYRKFGFDITDTIRNYYKRIDPPHCHVLSKHLVPAGKPKWPHDNNQNNIFFSHISPCFCEDLCL